MALFPLRDKNPVQVIRFQYVTAAIIAANVVVFLYQIGLPDQAAEQFILTFAAIPADLISGQSKGFLPPVVTLFTNLFIHADFMHLAGNMLFLWVFGDNVEDGLGHRQYALTYLICGVAANLAHIMIDPASTIPLVGASGAISGIVICYVILHPKVKVLVLIFMAAPVYLPAYLCVGSWVAMDVFNGFMSSGQDSGVAWWAHIGGYAAGAFAMLYFAMRGTLIFDRGKTVTLGAVRRRQRSHTPRGGASPHSRIPVSGRD